MRYLSRLLYAIGFVSLATSSLVHGETTFTIEDQSIAATESTVTVPIKVSGFSGIGGMQFTLAWDPAVLTYSSLDDFNHSAATTELFFFGETNFNLDNVSDGYFTVLYEQILAADATVADGETIFSVTFDVVGATGSSSEVSFTDDPTLRKLASFSGDAPELTTVNGTVAIGEQNTSPTDTTVPVITLLGDPSVTLTVGETYLDDGATASDDTDGNLTTSIVTVNGVDTSAAGTYTVTYNVSDAAGNAATQVSRTVVVEAAAPSDTTAPVITLSGDASLTLTVGETYLDDGATASDDTDGDLTASIVTVNGVDTSAAGSYTVTYNVSDAAGNAATQVSRTVVIEAAESEEPFDGTVLALADQNVSEGASTVTVPVTVSGFSGIGGFQFTVAWDPAVLTYSSLDDFNHSAATTELFFFGETNFNLDNVSDGYFTVLYEQILAADATVADGETIFSVTFDVVGATGSSSEVSFTDDPTLRKLASFSGDAPELTTVNGTVAIGEQNTSPTDTTVPVITLLGDPSVTLTVGETYLDDGATASDDTDGDHIHCDG